MTINNLEDRGYPENNNLMNSSESYSDENSIDEENCHTTLKDAVRRHSRQRHQNFSTLGIDLETVSISSCSCYELTNNSRLIRQRYL